MSGEPRTIVLECDTLDYDAIQKAIALRQRVRVNLQPKRHVAEALAVFALLASYDGKERG